MPGFLISAAILVVAIPTLCGGFAMIHRGQAGSALRGMAAAYPWSFEKGNDTSRTMAMSTAEEILRKANYASVPRDLAAKVWVSENLPKPAFGEIPTDASLEAYGKALHVDKILFGQVSWDTRSIWVNAGPKTVSTATVTVYVFDVAENKVVYTRKDKEGRSDEKSDGWKLAADVVLTPLVTVVSGGPAPPHEQRAVQIALGKALHAWVHTEASRR